MTIDNVKIIRNVGIVLVAVVIGFTAWIIVRPSNNTNEDQQTTRVGERKQEDVIATMLTYCQTTYRNELQKKAAVDIPTEDLSVINYNTVLTGNYARISMECHVKTAIDDSLKAPGLTAYLQYKKNAWTLYKHTPQTPACKDFDNKGWPREIVNECFDDAINGTRDIR